MKRSEDGNDLVIRFFEANRGKGELSTFSLSQPVSKASWVNFIEDPIKVGASSEIAPGKRIDGPVRPFEIRTVKIGLAGERKTH